jgi:hypothetical protein
LFVGDDVLTRFAANALGENDRLCRRVSSSRSDLVNVAVGFNPRGEVLGNAFVA